MTTDPFTLEMSTDGLRWLPLNQWTHIVITRRDRTTVKYVNGKQTRA